LKKTKFKRQEHAMKVQIWPNEKLIFYARNPRKNDAAIELDPKYVAVECRQSLSGHKAVLEGDGRTFDQIAGERFGEVWDAAA
jgi:hypothetical protein